MAARPKVIAFNVIDTLAPLDPVAGAMRQAGFPEPALPVFFAQLLHDAFAPEVTATFKPFPKAARASLRVVGATIQVECGNGELDAILGAFRNLVAAPDARPAFEAAREARARIITLTNGSADNTRALLERSGLADHVEHCLSIEAVGHWKPHPAVYRHAADICGVQPGDIALVAAHAWDMHGAKTAGLRTGWIAKREPVPSDAMATPDVQGASLDETVRRLLDG